jgi:hypothetical protein
MPAFFIGFLRKEGRKENLLKMGKRRGWRKCLEGWNKNAFGGEENSRGRMRAPQNMVVVGRKAIKEGKEKMLPREGKWPAIDGPQGAPGTLI